ncbi:MAG TPA: zinc ribbon domain-containing protein [Terriglobia bacterium]|nr:zinc ribbon domain-containing protein [Terriglobia bacterium]
MAKQCPSCQQLLDETARFCPICGASVEEVRSLDAPIEVPEGQLPPPLLPEGTPTGARAHDSSFHPPPLPSVPQSVLKPAFLGGVALGVLSALPLVNCCCLLWIGGGGLVAVYLLRQEFAGEITASIGAKAGFTAGMIGALFWQILELPISYITSSQRPEQIQQLLQSFPAETIQFAEKVFSLLADPFNPFVLLVGLVFKAVACGILTTLGGVVGAAFWGKPKNQ